MEWIKKIILECLNENTNISPQTIEEIKKFIGDTFYIQDSTAEITTGKEKDNWGNGGVFRERIENAGDILRELSSRGSRPDPKYIDEKIKKIIDWLKKDITEIPNNIKNLEEFNKTNLKWSNAVDGREYIVKFYPDLLKKIIAQYENIPVYSRETKLAKDMVLNLLYGNYNKLKVDLYNLSILYNEIYKNG
jgi:2-hydroxy-3-keto-5-methylthiopentenyl-1-phosphate phosphatase